MWHFLWHLTIQEILKQRSNWHYIITPHWCRFQCQYETLPRIDTATPNTTLRRRPLCSSQARSVGSSCCTLPDLPRLQLRAKPWNSPTIGIPAYISPHQAQPPNGLSTFIEMLVYVKRLLYYIAILNIIYTYIYIHIYIHIYIYICLYCGKRNRIHLLDSICLKAQAQIHHWDRQGRHKHQE